MTALTRLLPLVAFCLLAFTADDDKYPKDYFRSPLGIPLYMAGNFAEMRSNHFHSGLDLKTNGAEGYPIYAAADGWISRIVVSPVGFGNALYVAHPNGYTTVYAHLQRFSKPFASFVEDAQYRRQNFRVDLSLNRGQFPVKKGEVIAMSGNSGGSSGPHLHFEIRDAAQRPLNGLMFGLPIRDTTPPRIFAIKLYPQGDGQVEVIRSGNASPLIGTRHAPVELETSLVNGQYQLQGVDSLRVWGTVAFSVRAHDYQDGSRNRLGAYRIRLDADGSLLYESEMEVFSFGETRFLNSHVDYGEHRTSRRWFQRSHILPGNRLSLYETRDRGYLTATPGASVAMQYTIEDAMGNTVTLPFDVQGLASAPSTPADGPDYAMRIARGRAQTFQTDGLTASFAPYTFYEDIELQHERTPRPVAAYSDLHTLHSSTTPVHKRFSLSLRPDDLPARLRPHALIGVIDSRGNIGSMGGSYSNGVVTARIRNFGTFFVAVDTVGPTITPLNFRNGQNLSGTRSLEIKIEDDLAGISRYEGRINGQWRLFAYDAKRNRLSHTFDERTRPGNHELELIVHDNAGNVRVFRADFTR